MTTVMKAIYKNGVFKPMQHVYFPKQEKFCLLAIPMDEWKRQFSHLLKTIHQRTRKYPSSKIERDITYVFNELHKK